MKLGLGTVQFGLDYGISNKEGKTSLQEVEKILELAQNVKIKILDTAALYGESEIVLGKTLPVNHQFNVVTKTPIYSKNIISNNDVLYLGETFYKSLERMKQDKIYGLLIHNADDLLALNGNYLFKKMHHLKEEGLVQKIGVSVYRGSQIEQVLEKYNIDIIQLPINVLDQRLIESGHLKKLKERNIEIHARSIFLQGLLLMKSNDLDLYFEQIKDKLIKYHESIQKMNLTPLQAAIGFVMNIEEVDTVLCGVNNSSQLNEILSALSTSFNNLNALLKDFAVNNENILDPSKWVLDR